jgi:alkanesulfonate monooxygenase SsuD/methylene tetrahydromethanopterin reductase-like flavin-dependent oxidoreductase (luciferase family)
MHFGLYLPNYGAECSARALADLAGEAEAAGWDGFFLWDHILASQTQKLQMVDPWVALTAMAMSTERIRLGTSVTPIARRRPWKLARETVTLDHLSNGRLILSVGLGEPANTEFEQFGEDGDAKVRAAKLDEGLEILTGLWRGKSFSYQGQYYQVQKTVFKPATLQLPRIPIWVGGFWPNKAPFKRAARWDGVMPLKQAGWLQPRDVRDMLAFVHERRTSGDPFDVAVIGTTSSKDRATVKKLMASFVEAGATWWLEALYLQRDSIGELRERIRQGPPQVALG